MKLSFVAASVAAAVVVGQHPALADHTNAPKQAVAPEYADCERILNSPPANQLKKYTQDGTYSLFNDEVISPALIGIRCNPEQIKTYMEAAGWIPDQDRTRSRMFENAKYKSDYVMIFYKKSRSLSSFLFFGSKASGQANYDFYDNRLTSIEMGPTK